jgi:hypothetical protein
MRLRALCLSLSCKRGQADVSSSRRTGSKTQTPVSMRVIFSAVPLRVTPSGGVMRWRCLKYMRESYGHLKNRLRSRWVGRPR